MSPRPEEQRLLGLLLSGAAWKLPDLSARLGVSDSTTTRLLQALDHRVLSVGERRGRRYFGKRKVRDLKEDPVPIFRVRSDGTSELFAQLTPVGEAGYYAHFPGSPEQSRAFDDLPYFLAGLRPAGYLGRQVPIRHPELGNPPRIVHWSSDDTLRYLVEFGSDGPGDFIAGAEAFERYLAALGSPPSALASAARIKAYERLAAEQLQYDAGSSTAGEQPKFLASTAAHGPVLVKFSPPRDQVVGRRTADLLACEHLALDTLRLAGLPAAKTELLVGKSAYFLEVARFDRTPQGRRGVLPLGDLDAEFLGSAESDWPSLAESLARMDLIPRETLPAIRFLWAFGRLIANTDMHAHNLAFFTDGLTDGLTGAALTPTYDMSPMLYAPRQGHVVTPDFPPPMPQAADGKVWEAATQAASFFWELVSLSDLVSPEFRNIARANVTEVRKAAELAKRLPR